MSAGSSLGSTEPPAKPLLRGVSHQYAFFLSLAAGTLLGLRAEGVLATAGTIAFAASVAAMFGTSALYHRIAWSRETRLLMRRLDHAGAFLVIAGTYTVFGLLAFSGAWRLAILSIVWGGALAAIAFKVFWIEAPHWLGAAIPVALGWVGVVAFPLLLHGIGVTGTLFVLSGGIAYTLGAIVYARRSPDPFPPVFGYHEIFHLFVIVGVGMQYAAVAFYLLPRAG